MKKNFRNTLRHVLVGILLVVLSGCAADRAYNTGQEELAVGRYEDAVVHLEEAVKYEPTNARYRTTLRTVREQAVQRLLAEAERQLGAKRLDEAEKTFRRVLVIEPTNARALTGIETTRRAREHAPRLEEAQRLFQQKDLNAALALARRILAENPQQAEAAALLTRIGQSQVRDAHAPLAIKTRHIKPVSLQFRDANIRMVFEALSKIAGINFIFDSDVKASLKATIFVNQVKVEDAIDLVLAQSQLAQKVLNDNTLLIYPATPQKFKEYQEQIVKGFYLTNLDPKKAQAMLKTMLDINTVYVDERSNILFVRDAPEAVRMAEKLIDASDLADPEVMLEVEVLEIASATLQQLGIKYPDAVRFTLTGPDGEPGSLTWENLKSVNGNNISVSPLSVALDIAKQDGGAKVLASPRLRARSKEKAKIHIGDRVPVITSTSTPSTSGLQSTSSVQYIDTGLKLEIEPTVYLDSDVAIKLSLEVSNIVREVTTGATANSSGTVAYQIGTRNAATLLRLRDGETQVLAGLISDAERTTANKIPGLGDLPLLGRLFGTQKDDSAKVEIVLSITPHIVRSLKRPDADTSEFWYGTSAGKRGQPLTIQSVTSAEPLTPPPVDSAAPAAAPAPANGNSAANAPAALAAPAAVGAAVAIATPPAPAAALPVPFVLEGPERVVVGEEFEVALNVTTEQALNGLTLQLGYEPAVFEVVSVAPGPFALQASAPEKFSQQVNREQGRIEVKIAPGDGEGFTGAANVLVVTFKAIGAKAKSPVSVQAVTLSAPDGRAVTAMTPAPLTLATSQR